MSATEPRVLTTMLAPPVIVGAVPEQLDPRLQRLLARRRQGQVEPAAVASEYDEVSVIARVTDLTAWEEMSEVQPGASVESPGGGEWTVTARIPVPRIETVRRQPFVLTLKASQPLRPVLQKTLSETCGLPENLPAGSRSGGGRGVVVGIVDYGCDFKHENFRTADGHTRLLSIWHQDGPLSPQSPFGYGRRYSPAEIDAALQESDSYTALGYGPYPDRPGQAPGAHGTHVMDIAAGNGRGTGLVGMAPEADIIFVNLTRTPIDASGPGVVETSLGDSAQLLDAIRFIFDEAGDRPCVVNVSLGMNGGPHDGSTPVERFIDDITVAAPNRVVVIAAANSFADGVHAAGTVRGGETAELKWELPFGNRAHAELEVWYSRDDRFAVELVDPDGLSVIQVEPGRNGTRLQASGEVAIHVSNRLTDPNNGDNVIGVFLESGAPAGTWSVRLHGLTVTKGHFHAWIERNDLEQSHFSEPHDSSHTLGSISCGLHSLVVGSYDAHKTSLPLSFFSSSGPTRDGRQKPELSAPGHQVLAAHSRTPQRLVAKSGTSMAAPAVTGAVALVLAEARQRHIDLSVSEIRNILVESARSTLPTGAGWDPRYGHGRLLVSEAVRRVVERGGDQVVALSDPLAPLIALPVKGTGSAPEDRPPSQEPPEFREQ